MNDLINIMRDMHSCAELSGAFQGLGGAVCLWMDMLAPEHATSFPGYEL